MPNDVTPTPYVRYLAQMARLWTLLLEKVSDDDLAAAEALVGQVALTLHACLDAVYQDGLADGLQQGTADAAEQLAALQQDHDRLRAQLAALVDDDGTDPETPTLTH